MKKPWDFSCPCFEPHSPTFNSFLQALESQLTEILTEKFNLLHDLSQKFCSLQLEISKVEEELMKHSPHPSLDQLNLMAPLSERVDSFSKRFSMIETESSKEFEQLRSKVDSLHKFRSQLPTDGNNPFLIKLSEAQNIISNDLCSLRDDLRQLKDQNSLQASSDETQLIKNSLSDHFSYCSLENLKEIANRILSLTDNLELLKADTLTRFEKSDFNCSWMMNHVDSFNPLFTLPSLVNELQCSLKTLNNQVNSLQLDNTYLKDQLSLQKLEFEKLSSYLKNGDLGEHNNLSRPNEIDSFSLIKTLQTELEFQKDYFDSQINLLRISLGNQISDLASSLDPSILLQVVDNKSKPFKMTLIF